jgi:hypothetical protein
MAQSVTTGAHCTGSADVHSLITPKFLYLGMSYLSSLGLRESAIAHGFTWCGIAATKIIRLAILGVLGVLAVKEWFRIHRQDAKSAKNFAKQNSFQESKDF